MSYLGLDVLEISPNAAEPAEDTFSRSETGFDPGLGARALSARDSAPSVGRQILWSCPSLSEISALRAFLEARRGRLVPFWMPSRRQDLLLAQAVGASDPGITIQFMGYARYLFPSRARRHLAFWVGTSGWLYRSVGSASEGSGIETLTLSSPLGLSLPATALVCQLHYCRLASDAIGISFSSPTIAEARLPYVEVPQEAP